MRKILFLASVAILCASVAWAQDSSQQPTTQDPNAQSPSTSQSPTTSSPASNNTSSTSNTGIQGCLSGADGNYMLTQDGTGTVYKLAGADSKLKDHVGHEVQVTGRLANTGTQDQTQASTPSGNATAASANTLQVSDVTMVSEKCLTGSPSASNPSADAGTPAATSTTPDATSGNSSAATSTTPADSTANAGQTTPDNSSASAPAANSGSTGAAQPSYASPAPATSSASQNQETAQNSQPPQTSDNDAAMQSSKAADRKSDTMPKTASDLPEIGLLGLGLLAAGIASKRRNDLLG